MSGHVEFSAHVTGDPHGWSFVVECGCGRHVHLDDEYEGNCDHCGSPLEIVLYAISPDSPLESSPNTGREKESSG